MVLHGALSVLLARHGNGSDVVIGTPVANRLQKELDELIGFFVNTLVLRVDCSDNLSFIDHLERIKRVNLDAQSHQDVPFEMLVERVNPVRSTQFTPLFQIMFSMDLQSAATPAALQELELEPLGGDLVRAKYELTVHATEAEDTLKLSIDYNCDVFEAASIERLGRHFCVLLDSIAAQPEQPIHALQMLEQSEREYLLGALNATVAPFPRSACLHTLFEEQAERTPAATAVFYEGDSLSYQQLNERANHLALYLRQHGVGPDGVVALYHERGLHSIVSTLAILKAGGAYLPLDPGYPQERLAFMVQDSQVSLLLTEGSLLAQAQELTHGSNGVRVICVDERLEPAGRETSADLCLAVQSPQSLAYVIYTSGSTGKPKGVMISHESACNLAAYQRATFDIDVDSQVLGFSSVSFDAAVFEWLLALLNGATLRICAEEHRRDVAAIEHYLVAQGITHTLLSPALVALLRPERPYRLRVLIVGGEACTDRGDRLCHRGPVAAGAAGPYRQAAGEYVAVPARRPWTTGPVRRGRGTVYRRRRRGARIPQPRRADSRALCRQSVRDRQRWSTPVSHR
jgi:non-ribosomal peptide synthetase component F